MSADFLTLFSPAGGELATKRVTAAGVEPAPLVKYHRVAEHPVGSFDELTRSLGSLTGERQWYLVRGKLKPLVDRNAARRTHAREEDATLEPAAHHWFVLDLDHVDDSVPPEAFAADPARYANETRARLPACFRDARAFWQATSSAGVKPGIRLRMAFWLSRPMGDDEIKAWLASWALVIANPQAVDTSLYTPSQPHFTAIPLFDGVPDPVPAGLRWGVLPGTLDEVHPPAEVAPGSAAHDALDRTRRKLARLEEGERRKELNKAAYLLARRYSEAELATEKIERALGDAIAPSGLPGDEVRVTLANAIRDGRAAREAEHAGWKGLLARDTKTDAVKNTQANVTLCLEFHEAFAARIGRNARTGRAVWLTSPDWGPRDKGAAIEGADVARIVEWFQARMGIEAKEAWVRSGLDKVSADAPEYDRIQEWLRTRPAWDGTERLATTFIRHLGVEDTQVTRAFTLIWFLQAVRRPFATVDAVVKADHMVLLVGPQGLGKSSIFELLAPPGAFRADLPDVSSKDARQAVSDAWIIELSEFTQRKADRDTFKAFTSATLDKFRPPYGRDEVLVPRRCVIAITTNEDVPLEDDSGNRRFFPMRCTKRLDFAALRAERDQLWAEALALSARVGDATVPPELADAVRMTQEEYRDAGAFVDVFVNAIDRTPSYGIDWESGQIVDGRVKWLRTGQACAMVSERASNPRVVGKVKAALRDAGWRERRVWEGAAFRRAWYPPAVNAARAQERVN